MTNPNKRFVFVASTSGSVMNQVLATRFLRQVVHSVVADRPCEALEKARSWGVPTILLEHRSPELFCEKLDAYMREQHIDYVISFYTQFYSARFRDTYRDRIINFHPSLLPAFKGMDGFGDGVAYHTKIIGTTVEFIKDVMDEGKIIMQTACTVDPTLDREVMRHRIFVQQCKTLLQVVKWLIDDRMRVNGDQVTIIGGGYHDHEFVPALDCREAAELRVEFPSMMAGAATASAPR